jgi:hypothetical protein
MLLCWQHVCFNHVRYLQLHTNPTSFVSQSQTIIKFIPLAKAVQLAYIHFYI